jgi:hypothetical protein
MKYFENLPKKTFESTIGNFLISDFFTFLDPNLLTVTKSNITIDSKKTLLEAAHLTYNDPNSFWMFVSSNETINPFNLLAENTVLFLTENEVKTSLQLTGDIAGTTSYTFPKGSIILPFTSNTGGSYSYSSVGNFDVNGPISIIESVSYYQDKMIIKDQRGATFEFISQDGTTGSQMVIVYPTSGGTYAIEKPLLPINTKSATKEVVKVELSEEGQIEVIAEAIKTKSSPKVKSAPSSISSSPKAVSITAIEEIQLDAKTISAYLPIETGKLKTMFVTTKYK